MATKDQYRQYMLKEKYTRHTIDQYTGYYMNGFYKQAKSHLGSLMKPYNSIYEIDDINFLKSIYAKISTLSEYKEVNDKYSGGINATFNLYIKFLESNFSSMYAKGSNDQLENQKESTLNLGVKKRSFNVMSYFTVQVTQHILPYRSYITAIKSKPFLLLAGISGTGKSRIVRELAKACWKEGDEEYGNNHPKNFEIVQVKPNWHDSSELIGYVSRVSGSPVFVAGDFLKFVAKAWENPDVPYFLCLDEMNLAPVEQYFAEYLSVVESRKADLEGNITTDPILKKSKEDWYRVLTSELTDDDNIRNRFLNDGICIPQNLIVVGTVNMDETTFSFSRKVLDRAMTIEMNEVNLYAGLDDRYEQIGKLEAGNLIGTAVEGVDIYNTNKSVCDTTLKYLETVNTQLEGTPFKVAYRTRNEFLLYVVNNLPYNKGKDGNELDENFVIARALDEITSMKILSRIEGDETKIGNLLDRLTTTIIEQLKAVSGKDYSAKKDEANKEYSVSLAKLAEMKKRLESGYTSFWS